MSRFESFGAAHDLLSEEFAHVRRHRLGDSNRFVVRIGPGEYYVTARGELISTVLGSCVAACVRNRASGIGGMNHFLLPAAFEEDPSRWRQTPVDAPLRYGNLAMEKLINVVLGERPQRGELEIKVFGGARVLRANIDVGDRNVSFVRDYLRKEGLAIAAADLGGTAARKIVFDPGTGTVFVKSLASTQVRRIASQEMDYMETIRRQTVGGGVELFDQEDP